MLSSGESHLTLETITRLSQRLPDNFLRIHRSYLVNLDHLRSFNRETVQAGEKELPVSRTYRKPAMEILEKLRDR